MGKFEIVQQLKEQTTKNISNDIIDNIEKSLLMFLVFIFTIITIAKKKIILKERNHDE